MRLSTSNRHVSSARTPRQPFDIHRVITALKAAASAWNAPVVTLIANQSDDPFQILVSCLLSLRTKDETTGPAARRLFQLAHTPEAMVKLSACKPTRTFGGVSGVTSGLNKRSSSS